MEIWAEAGTCEGSLDYALRAATAVAEAGADALKVQWHRPETLATTDAPRYDHTDTRVLTQRELCPTPIPYAEWGLVVRRCQDLGIAFIPALFDLKAVEFAAKHGLTRVKIASGDITFYQLISAAATMLHYASRNARELVISTGASSTNEILDALVWARDTGYNGLITLLACHLEYPSDIRNANLGRVAALQHLSRTLNMEHVRVGYSDHTPGLHTVGPLTIMGSAVLEKHLTLLGPGNGGDHEFAVFPSDLANMVRQRNSAQHLYGSEELEPSPDEMAARVGARRSLVTTVDIPKGSKLDASMFTILRPGTGIPPVDLPKVLDTIKPQRAMINIPAGSVVTWRMIGRVSGTLSVE